MRSIAGFARYFDLPMLCVASVLTFAFLDGCKDDFGKALLGVGIAATLFETIAVVRARSIKGPRASWRARWERVRLAEEHERDVTL